MSQITISNPEIVSKIQNDASFRKTILANTTKLINDSGFSIDQETLDKAVAKQLAGIDPKIASTAILITIF